MLKPFNLERALAGDPVVTRDGREAKVVYASKSEQTFHILVVIYEDNVADAVWVDKDGKEWQKVESDLDLFMSPKTKRLFCAVSNNKIASTSDQSHRIMMAHQVTYAFDSKEELKKAFPSIIEAQIVSFEVEVE